jgi:acetyltransferase-like isoleucine patch superfamily enzyme
MIYKNKENNRDKWQDKASSYHITLLDHCITFLYKLFYKNLFLGKNSIIKRRNEFRLTDNYKIEVGDNCIFKEGSYFLLTKPNPYLKIGNNVGIGRNCYLAIKSKLTIGDNTRFGHNITILDNEHKFNKNDLISNQEARIEEITIGEDCWIGSNTTILRGVEICNNSVVGANSLVNKSIPANQIWGGNPARFLKKRI